MVFLCVLQVLEKYADVKRDLHVFHAGLEEANNQTKFNCQPLLPDIKRHIRNNKAILARQIQVICTPLNLISKFNLLYILYILNWTGCYCALTEWHARGLFSIADVFRSDRGPETLPETSTRKAGAFCELIQGQHLQWTHDRLQRQWIRQWGAVLWPIELGQGTSA